MSSSKLVSIVALVTALCVLVLIGLQVAELQHYGKAPSVWPASAK